MTDICPIHVESEFYHFGSIFQTDQIVVQVPPFFAEGCGMPAVIAKIWFLPVFLHDWVSKKSKNLVSLFFSLWPWIICHIPRMCWLYVRQEGEPKLCKHSGEGMLRCLFEKLKKNWAVDRRFSEIEHLCFASIEYFFDTNKILADALLQNIFAKIRSEVDCPQGLSKINFWETINYQRLQSINLILQKINQLIANNCN